MSNNMADGKMDSAESSGIPCQSVAENRVSNRPRSKISNDSALYERGSRLSNKSLDDGVETSTAPTGSQVESTTNRYTSQEAHRSNLRPDRVQQKLHIDNRFHMLTILPKCHFRQNTGSKDYRDLYREKKQLMLQIMDLKEGKRLRRYIKMLRLEYEN